MRRVPAALLDLSHLVQDGLLGAGVGAIAGRIVVHRAEQRRGELAPQRVRHLEVRWTVAGALFAFLFAPWFR